MSETSTRTKFRPIHQLAAYLSQMQSHSITIDGKTIVAKSRFRFHPSFPSFKIRYLSTGKVSLKPSTGRSYRYADEASLIQALDSMAMTQDL